MNYSNPDPTEAPQPFQLRMSGKQHSKLLVFLTAAPVVQSMGIGSFRTHRNHGDISYLTLTRIEQAFELEPIATSLRPFGFEPQISWELRDGLRQAIAHFEALEREQAQKVAAEKRSRHESGTRARLGPRSKRSSEGVDL